MDNWLWKVDKTEFSASEFSNDYKIYIDLMAWQMGTTAPVLEEYLNKSSQLADPKTRGIIEQMKPEPFAENFLVLSLLKKHAMEHKYFDQPSTKIKKEFISDYIMIQLYLNDVIQKLPVDIKNEDAEKEWLS
ncbi:MAG: hypothetical protein OEV66_01485, partial [Spirochaetia bacterium]|nr:hypothetical protein [Spirochaetia bacterium]